MAQAMGSVLKRVRHSDPNVQLHGLTVSGSALGKERWWLGRVTDDGEGCRGMVSNRWLGKCTGSEGMMSGRHLRRVAGLLSDKMVGEGYDE